MLIKPDCEMRLHYFIEGDGTGNTEREISNDKDRFGYVKLLFKDMTKIPGLDSSHFLTDEMTTVLQNHNVTDLRFLYLKNATASIVSALVMSHCRIYLADEAISLVEKDGDVRGFFVDLRKSLRDGFVGRAHRYEYGEPPVLESRFLWRIKNAIVIRGELHADDVRIAPGVRPSLAQTFQTILKPDAQ